MSLTSNNTELQNILATINALPEASEQSRSVIETGTVTITKSMGGPGEYDYRIPLTDIPNWGAKSLFAFQIGTDAIIIASRANANNLLELSGYVDAYESSDMHGINVLGTSSTGYIMIYNPPYDAKTATYYAV